MMNIRMNVEEEVWKKYICERIQEVERKACKVVLTQKRKNNMGG